MSVPRWRVCEARTGGGDAVQFLQDERERALHDERRGSVDDVLARGAVMRVLGVVAQCSRERLGRVARAPALGSQPLRVERRSGRLGDGGGRGVRDHARLGLGRRERTLRLEHRLRPGAVADGGAQPAGTKSALKGKEHRRPLALHADVESEATFLLAGDERRAVGLWQ